MHSLSSKASSTVTGNRHQALTFAYSVGQTGIVVATVVVLEATYKSGTMLIKSLLYFWLSPHKIGDKIT